jgi:hypothetical protein
VFVGYFGLFVVAAAVAVLVFVVEAFVLVGHLLVVDFVVLDAAAVVVVFEWAIISVQII